MFSENSQVDPLVARNFQLSDFIDIDNFKQDTVLHGALMEIPFNGDTTWLTERFKSALIKTVFHLKNAASPLALIAFTDINENRDYAYLSIALSKDSALAAVGKMLLGHALEIAAVELNVRKLVTSLRADQTTAVDLFSQNGFRTVGHLKSHFTSLDHVQHDGVMMEIFV